MLHKYNSLPSKFVDMNGKYGKKKWKISMIPVLLSCGVCWTFRDTTTESLKEFQEMTVKKKKSHFITLSLSFIFTNCMFEYI